MPVNTAAPGKPGDVHAVADWMRTTLGARIGEAAGDLHTAVNTAGGGWLSPGGEAFRTRTTRSAQGTDELATTTTDAARAVDDLAVGLAATQAEMHEIRLAAAADGLQVDGDDILDPGPAPADPGPMTIGPATTQAEVDAHALAVEARTRWNRASAAYTRAGEAVDAVLRHWNQVVLTTFRNAGNDVRTKWFLSAGDMVGASAQGLVVSKASSLRVEADRLRRQADDAMARARSAPVGTPRDTVYRDVDQSRRLAGRATELSTRSSSLGRAGKLWGVRLGGGLAAAGVVYDIATGKPADQAIVSGAAGFGASLLAGAAAGAAVGTLVPIPGVGTVVGGVVGAAAGLFASGAVDALYEHGVGEVGAAWDAGVEAVTETGAAIGDLGTGVWDALF